MTTKPAFELRGKVEAVLVATDPDSLISKTVRKMQVLRGQGVRGDRHAGTRLADVRDKAFLDFGLPKGMEVTNLREFSAVSVEELTEISKTLRLPMTISYGYLGENLVVSGIPKFTMLPPGTMLFFQKSPQEFRTAVLVVWAENMPCAVAGDALQKRFGRLRDIGRLFPKAAIGKRGVVGCVYASGNIRAGDTVIVKVPRQNIYRPE